MKFFGRRTISVAAGWFAKSRSGRISGSDDASWSVWLHRNDQHARSYENLELAWELSEELRHRPQIETWLQEIDSRKRSPIEVPERHGLSGLRPFWRSGAVVATLLVAAIVTLLLRDRPITAEYATSIGEQRSVTLNDGSVVALNTATHLTVRYSRDVRRIELASGEADFLVSADTRRPFEVYALHGVTTAVGTEFDVEVNPAAATVAVLKGSVRVQAGEIARLQISAGEAVKYTSEGNLSPVGPADTNRVRAWQARRVVFNDLPLADALIEYNRYLKIPIVAADPGLAARHINGVFGIDNSAAFLDVVQQTLHVKATTTPSSIVLEPR